MSGENNTDVQLPCNNHEIRQSSLSDIFAALAGRKTNHRILCSDLFGAKAGGRLMLRYFRAACLFAVTLAATHSAMAAPTQLKPVGDMPMWYYRCARLFRYPIPTDFEFAYINRKGEVAITGPFEKANNFSNGIACVVLGCYKRHDGKWIYAVPKMESGSAALLKNDGQVVLHLPGNLPESFYDKYATTMITKIRKKTQQPEMFYELMDGNGKVVTNNKWLAARSFSEGLAAVTGPEASDISDADKQTESMAGKGSFAMGFGSVTSLNDLGKVGHVPAEYNGFAPDNSPWGYRDQSGKTIISTKLSDPGRFSEGLATVKAKPTNFFSGHDRNDPTFYHPDNFSYIDKTGNIVIPGPFMEAQPFKGGLAAIMKNGKWGYIDKSGKEVVPCQYDWAGDFKSTLAPVEKNELVGYIDKTGKVVIDFLYKDGKEFSDGVAPVTRDGRRWGYIDENGKDVIEAKFQRAFPFNDGLALVYIDARKEIVPTASDAPFFLASAVNYRSESEINNARLACKATIDCAPESASAKSARTMLQCALPDHDLSPEVQKLFTQGIENAQIGKLPEAEKLYKQALALDPEFFALAGSLAYVYKNTNRSDEAIALLQKTFEKHPSYARGYWWLWQIYKAKGDDKLAQENRAKAVSLDPDDPYLHR